MATWIKSTGSAEEIARQADAGISEVAQLAKRGYVGDEVIANSPRSYFYTDSNNVLQFYNVKTGETNAVDLT